MRRTVLWVVLSLLVITPASADPIEPARGSDLRADLLDTLRPLVEYHLDAPVEFVVAELQVDGDRAFGRLRAQRPGGVSIDIAQTSMVLRRGEDPGMIDGPRLEAFFERRGGRWQVIDYVIGSTDVWWYGYNCPDFGSLLRQWGC